MNELSPGDFILFPNHPNPFNPTTVISYQLPVMSKVKFKIYDFLGRDIATLINREECSGYHETRWNADKYSSDVYVCVFEAENLNDAGGNFYQGQKLVLLK